MPTGEYIPEDTQSLIKRAIELIRESEELVQDTKDTRRRLNRSRRLCRKSVRSFRTGPRVVCLDHVVSFTT